MKLAGVIGWPIAHSLSPKLHGYWLRELGIDGAYVPLAVQQEDFGRAIDTLPRMGFTGVSVTLPHKEAAFALARSLDASARQAGAVNQLIFQNSGIHGFNSDVAGFIGSLHDAGITVSKKAVVVVGSGGGARAIVAALRQMGAGEIRVLNRTPARAGALGADLNGGLGDWKRSAMDASLLVNATPAGMKNQPPLSLDLDALQDCAVVCDIVYNPIVTPLLRAARKRGLRTIDGLGMLLHQAVPAFEAFFGARPKVTPAVRKVLEDALGYV